MSCALSTWAKPFAGKLVREGPQVYELDKRCAQTSTGETAGRFPPTSMTRTRERSALAGASSAFLEMTKTSILGRLSVLPGVVMAATCCRGAVAVTMATWVIAAREEATMELDLGLAQRDVPTTCWAAFIQRGDAALGPPTVPGL